jgi:hypothetical protein
MIRKRTINHAARRAAGIFSLLATVTACENGIDPALRDERVSESLAVDPAANAPDEEGGESVVGTDRELGVPEGETVISGEGALAAACTRPTLKFYPGSAATKARFGEVDYFFEVCDNLPHTSWTAKTTKKQTNGTGEAMAFFIDDASVVKTKTGHIDTVIGRVSWANYEANIYWKKCLPWVGHPCTQSGRFKIDITAEVIPTKHSASVTVQKITVIPAKVGFDVFRSP